MLFEGISLVGKDDGVRWSVTGVVKISVARMLLFFTLHTITPCPHECERKTNEGKEKKTAINLAELESPLA